jgi:hypothetical protein
LPIGFSKTTGSPGPKTASRIRRRGCTTAIHGVFLAWALGWQAGLLLALAHILIDTRLPLRWWQRIFRQTTRGEVALYVRSWVDQTFHLVSIAIAVLLMEAYF